MPWEDIEVLNQQAIGYKPISISWSDYWGGLVKSNNGFEGVVLLDGSAGLNHWWYSLGVINPGQYNPFYPGPCSSLVYRSTLWIRVSSPSVLVIGSSLQKKLLVLTIPYILTII